MSQSFNLYTADKDETARIIRIGRQAAQAALLATARAMGRTYGGDSCEMYSGVGDLKIDNFNLTPAIDAAIIEAIAEIRHPSATVTSKSVAARKRFFGIF